MRALMSVLPKRNLRRSLLINLTFTLTVLLL